jgi:hypothetical protein
VLVDEAATTLHFPQVADGSGYRSSFILVNPSMGTANATLEFFSSDGTPLTLPIGGVSSTHHTISIPQDGAASVLTDGSSSGLAVGWAKVTSNVAVGGSSVFQTLGGTTITSAAGVSASPVTSHFTTYVESIGDAESGLAICNPNANPVTLAVRLRNRLGEIVAATSLLLPSQGHTARFFTEWFEESYSDFEGTVEVISSAPVAGVALRYDNRDADVFATLPVVVVR